VSQNCTIRLPQLITRFQADHHLPDAVGAALPSWPLLALERQVGEAHVMTLEPASYPRHRFPAGIIRHAVWLYHVFSLSLRDVELILVDAAS
jgi:hypothetical protein